MAAPIKICSSCFRSIHKPIFLIKQLQKPPYVVSKTYSTDSDEPYGKETHFGFKTVLESEKTEKVHEVFSNVAGNYDAMNDAMSLGIHRLWKDRFMQVLRPTPGTRLLDVAGGTGDIAFRFLDFVKNTELTFRPTTSIYSRGNSKKVRHSDSSSSSSDSDNEEDMNQKDQDIQESYFKNGQRPSIEHETMVTVCDINKSMLAVGKQRAEDRGVTKDISWVAGNAEELPIASESVDAYTIAFGIRNVTHMDEALQEAYRVLVPGGRFLCLEFSHVSNLLLQRLYDSYSFQVIPVLGQIIASDWKSYQYLVESIRQFPNQVEFSKRISDAGFAMVTYENLSFGIAAIHSGFKLPVCDSTN